MHFISTGVGVTSECALEITSGWEFAGVPSGTVSSAEHLNASSLDWLPAVVPGTVAQSLEAAGRWCIDSNTDLDELDWWYRVSLPSLPEDENSSRVLRFSGLATLADVWLNGTHILDSENMFVTHSVDVTELLRRTNELVVCFRSLAAALSVKRPRPRWKTNLVNHQQLRWFRTTLLGRIPGWTPVVAPVGPWRSISLDVVPSISVDDINLNAMLVAGGGVVEFCCKLRGMPESADVKARLSVSGQSVLLMRESRNGQCYLTGRLELKDVALWWPHTHGEPVLHHSLLSITSSAGEITVDCGEVGFRHIELLDDQVGFLVNGRAVFCRGACWTVNDIVSLAGAGDRLEHYLSLAVDAGMNMVRIGGTMIYENDHFYRLCDKFGIMVWQDFMFANMDYPVADENFRTSVELEVTQQLKRWRRHPCITVYCGNSEVEQQAAMLGMPAECWRNELFSTLLPALCCREHAGIPYIPSTPSGGMLPFHVGEGVSHYYGVGAYLRPLNEVKSAGVRFASECLGFSNVPEQSTVKKTMGRLTAVTHHPKWKSRVPRDTGANWDFEDTRDHYLERLFSVDAVKLRSFDSQRYFDLGRVVTGEVMAHVFSEWRRADNPCQGGLVWFFNDLWPGAGWGIVDSEGLPKACYYYLKRVWASQVVLLTDEGMDGLHIHVINEAEEVLTGAVELAMVGYDGTVVASATRAIALSSCASLVISCDELLGAFYDPSYAYRFGPPRHDVVVATLLNEDGRVISEANFFPQSRNPALLQKPVVNAAVSSEGDDYCLVLESDSFLHAVHFDVAGYLPDDNYFCLKPGREKVVKFKKHGTHSNKFRAYVEAINLPHPIKAVLTPEQ